MTTITATRAFDMSTFDVSYPFNVINPITDITGTSGKFTVKAPGGVTYAFVGNSLGSYDALNYPHTGTFTKLVITDGTGTITINFSMSVTTFFGFVTGHDTAGFLTTLMAGNDSLNGSAFNDVLNGYAGNDTFDLTGGGNDAAQGGIGADTFNLGAAFNIGDKIDGGADSDVMNLNGDYSSAMFFAADTMVNVEKLNLATGHSYNLRLVDANVTTGQTLNVDGSALGAADVLTFVDAGEVDGAITVTGGAGADHLFTGGGADKLSGGAGNDELRGGGGADKLIGGDGDDYLNGGAGKDNFDGGAGMDRVSLFDAAATQAVTVDLFLQVVVNDGYGNKETMTSIEGIGAATRFADLLVGNDSANFILGDTADTVYGYGGDDMFQIGGAPGVLDGGAGTDTILSFTLDTLIDINADGIGDDVTSTSGVIVSLAAGMIVDDGFGNSGLVVGIENVGGSAGTDTLIGDANANVLAGSDENDTLRGGDGNDSLYGDGSFVSGGAIGWPTTAVANTGAGDDVLLGGHGDDLLDGGQGVDTASYADMEAGVAVDLTKQGIAQNTGVGGNDTLKSIENLIGSDFNDTLTGDGLDNVINGGSGNDSINLYFGGNDTAFGGDGADTFVVGGALDNNDHLDGGTSPGESAPGPLDTVVFFGPAESLSFADQTLQNIEYLYFYPGFLPAGHWSVTSSDGNIKAGSFMYFSAVDVGAIGVSFTFDASAETNGNVYMLGGAGDDTQIGGQYYSILYGGLGNDTLTGSGGLSYVSYLDRALNVGVNVSLALQGVAQDTGTQGVDTINNIENIVGSANDDHITGDGLANIIVTGGGNDVIDAGDGDDRIEIETGNNVVDGGIGVDIASWNGTIYGFPGPNFINLTGGVTVSLLLEGVVQNTGQGTILLSNIENLQGSKFADTLSGDNSANTVYGAEGDDTLLGKDGNDFLYGDHGVLWVDPLHSFDGAGNDTLMGGHGDDLLDGGDGTDTASYADMEAGVTVSLAIQGVQQNTGAVGGMDTLMNIENLTGSGYNDTLTGSSGDNVISGGAGFDVINIDNGGNDTVFGGDDADTISVGGALTAADHLDGGSSAGDANSGGSGTGDMIVFYGPAQNIVLADSTVQNIELMYFYPGFLPSGHWSIKLADGNIGANQHMSLWAVDVTDPTVSFTFDGSAETNGNFYGFGGSGNDTITGGNFYSNINGGLGNDTLTAGGGITFLSYVDPSNKHGASSAVTVSLALQGAAQNTIGQGSDTLKGFVNLVGSQYDDHLTGDGKANILVGDGGNDTISAGGGGDTVELSLGYNVADGGAGTDIVSWYGYIQVGTGIPLLNLTGGVSVSLLLQGSNQNTGQGVVFLTGFENLEGSQFNDVLTGNNADNTIYGAQGDDIINGNAGNDILSGDHAIDWVDPTHFPDGAGADRINGGKGNDMLTGGGGADLLTGGADADTFVYASVSDSNDGGFDRITDFTVGSDHIQLWFAVSAVDASVSTDKLAHLAGAADAAHLGAQHALLANVGGVNYLVVDANGVAGYQAGLDLLIRMDNVATIHTGDFTVG